MRIDRLAVLGAVTLLAAPAYAADFATVRLKDPVANRQKVIAGAAVFTCQDTACTSASPPIRSVTLEACRALRKRLGRIESLEHGARALSATQLAACNGDEPRN